MYRITILFAILLSVSAKILNFNENYENELAGNSNIGFDNYKRLGSVNRRPLWILDLKDDWTTPQLRLGTEEENLEFNYYARPLIKNTRRMKKDDPNNPKQIPQTLEDEADKRNENINLKKEIWKIINKFAVSTNIEPDAYLSENGEDNEPSIQLHFKGDYTTLVVECENKIWRFFMNPPSPLPGWFYEIHDVSSEHIQVPDTVNNEFHKTLLRLVHLFLTFPDI